MAAGRTYTPIATTTLSAQTNVTFNSISGSYTDLVLVADLIQDAASAANVFIQVGNGSVDTGSNYSVTIMWGNGTAAQSARGSNQTYWYSDYAAGSGTGSERAPRIFNLQNYANTTTYKTFISRSGKAGSGTDVIVGLWRSTSAIDTLKIFCNNNLSGVVTLYGILAA